MADTVVGMFWNRNEGDILEETLQDALLHVDSLFIADDGSTDSSWKIIQSFKNHPKVEYIRNHREDPNDVGQRQSLLNEIRRRYKPENTWVQIIESDIMILDTDVKQAIKDYAVSDLGVSWQTLNAARLPGTWKEVDTYPKWERPIKEIMPYAHWIEYMLYTFRPLPNLSYDYRIWRPWPNGWKHYTDVPLKVNRRGQIAPLLAHYGYRGPTHFTIKYRGKYFNKYPSWKSSSIEEVEKTVYFFNGVWNKDMFPMSREGWISHRKN